MMQIVLGGLFELGEDANKRVLAHMDMVTADVETRRWSLAGGWGQGGVHACARKDWCSSWCV